MEIERYDFLHALAPGVQRGGLRRLEADRLRDTLEGFAPTYAAEMQLLGHAKITFDTPADDPGYLALIAAQKRWLEVSSVSNFETYQANRLKLRYKNKDGKTQLLHTLNGSALALPRIVAAILENNQTEAGIKMPAALEPYLSFTMID